MSEVCPDGNPDCQVCLVKELESQLSAALAKVEELSLVALEAAAMLSETNHGGLTHLRSVSMQMALEAARVPIPPSCSRCPHPARDGLAAKVAELEAELVTWKESASMACEEPASECDCAGCSYAREKSRSQ